ncbi:MAG: hypothetical protein M1823_007425, partial [Watsoniomyces obsoletus]
MSAPETLTPNLDPVFPHLNTLLTKREHPKTLCPSEVARALSNSELQDAGVSTWRELMPNLRTLCFQMRDQGEIEILQKGDVIPEEQGEVD